MQPVASVVALGGSSSQALAQLDATALACDVLPYGDDLFRRLKRAESGSLLFLLAVKGHEPALAVAVMATSILKLRGGVEAAVVLPSVPAITVPSAIHQ